MINGRKYAWEDLKAVIANHCSYSLQDVSWDEEQELEGIYGAGSKPIGYGQGNWKASGKVTMLTEEYMMMLSYAKGIKGGIFRFSPFNIILNYSNEEEPPHTIKLLQCKFVKKNRKGTQGDKKTTVDLDIAILGDITETDINGIPVSASGI